MDVLLTKPLPACRGAAYPRLWGHRGPCKKFCTGSKRRYILFEYIFKRTRPAHEHFKRERWLYSTPSNSQPAMLPHIHVHGGTGGHAKNFRQPLSIDILYLNTYARGHGQHMNTSKENDGCILDQAIPSLPWCPISTSMGAQGAMQKHFDRREATLHSI